MIDNKGLDLVAQLVLGTDWQMAIGTGTTPAWVDNETLETETDRQDAVLTQETSDIENDTIVFTASFTFDSTVNITEFGIFHKSAPTYMLDRIVQPKTTMKAGMTMDIIMHIKMKRA